MAVTFTQAKNTLDEIAKRSERNRQRVAQAKQLLATAASDLAAMATAYATFVSDLNTAAAANSDNTAWQGAKAEKDLMVSDFQTLKTEVETLSEAVGN